MRNLMCLMLLLTPVSSLALETTGIEFRDGQVNDGEVSIHRDENGNLVFQDANAGYTTLTEMATTETDHGSLSGLEGDDHVQYLNGVRHTATHNALYNAALPIPADVGGNETLGSHTGDVDIHLDRGADEQVPGTWSFENGIIATGIRIGLGQYESLPAIRVEDVIDDAELLYRDTSQQFELNRAIQAPEVRVLEELNGSGTAEIMNFVRIGDIQLTDLVASTADESIAGRWVFVNGLSTPEITCLGLPETKLSVFNGGFAAISAGDAVGWEGIDGDALLVSKIGATLSPTTPFAGFALDSAGFGAPLTIVVQGVATANSAGTFSAGALLTWNGSGVKILAGPTETSAAGYALEESNGSGTARVYIQRIELPLP